MTSPKKHKNFLLAKLNGHNLRKLASLKFFFVVKWILKKIFGIDVKHVSNVGQGVVEVFHRKTISGWVVPKNSTEKIWIKVNGKVVSATRPNRTMKFEGKQRTYGFSRKMRSVWNYLGSGDYVEVEYCGNKLPIAGYGFRYLLKPKIKRKSRVAEMFEKIEQGYVFDKYGGFRLSIQDDLEWQKGIMDLFDQVKSEIKEKFDLNIFPTYGTMLGAIREGDFIGHDNDFDTTYISKHSDPDEVKAEFIEICSYLIDQGYDLFVKKTHAWVKVPGTKHKFDIFFSYFNSDGKYELSYGYHGEELVKNSSFFEFVERKLGSVNISIPKNHTEMLGQIYGKTWKIPDPGFSHALPTRKWDQNYHLSVQQVSSMYWKQFYRDNPISGGSPFAKFMAEKLTPSSNVFELGCGTGRDSVYFAKHGHSVMASDRSDEALIQGKESAEGLSNISFEIVDASNHSEVWSFFEKAFLSDAKGSSRRVEISSSRSEQSTIKDLVYMRFFLHSVPKTTQDIILDCASKSMPSGAALALEFRTEKDKEEDHVFGSHYRRFIPMAEMLDELAQYGFEIEHSEESQGLSPYKGEDPFLCRIIALKQ